MEREILFRGLSIGNNNKWIVGSLIISTVGGKKHYHIQQENTAGHAYCYEVLAKSVGQFTGKRDVFKKRIFEKDIVSFVNYGTKQALVEYSNRAHAFVLKSRSYGKEHTKLSGRGQLTIIGNVIESPELA